MGKGGNHSKTTTVGTIKEFTMLQTEKDFMNIEGSSSFHNRSSKSRSYVICLEQKKKRRGRKRNKGTGTKTKR